MLLAQGEEPGAMASCTTEVGAQALHRHSFCQAAEFCRRKASPGSFQGPMNALTTNFGKKYSPLYHS